MDSGGWAAARDDRRRRDGQRRDRWTAAAAEDGRRQQQNALNLEVRHGVGIASIFGEKRPILCVTEKKHQKSNPHIGLGTPRIGLGRDLSIFQIGESPKRFGVHSILGTNRYIYLGLCPI